MWLNTAVCCLLVLKTSVANSVDLDQTAHLWSGSTLFICMPKLVLDINRWLQHTTYWVNCWKTKTTSLLRRQWLSSRVVDSCVNPEGGGGGGGGAGGPEPPPLKNHKTVGFLSITGPVPLKKTFAGSRGRCLNTKPKAECSNTFRGTRRTLIHSKPWLIPILA